MTPTLITGTADHVRDILIALARDGDHRARPIEINGNRGVVTPHTTPDGTLDTDDLAAQTHALAHGHSSIDATYTRGHYIADGRHHIVSAPPDAAATDTHHRHPATTFTQDEAHRAIANGLIDRTDAPQNWNAVGAAIDHHLDRIEREQGHPLDRTAVPSQTVRRILDTLHQAFEHHD